MPTSPTRACASRAGTPSRRLRSALARAAAASVLGLALAVPASAQTLQLNDREYYEADGVNVLVFSNQYDGMFYDEKNAGIEIIHHGIRTATNGGVRLQNTPEQWDLIPDVVSRTVDPETGAIDVTLRYEDYGFEADVHAVPEGDGLRLSVDLDEPVPAALVGKAGFNLEFLPSAYFRKTYLVDGVPNVFPRHPSGPSRVAPLADKVPQYNGQTTFDDRGLGQFIVPEPIAEGRTLVLAPEDPAHRVVIRSEDADLLLFDGRLLAQNGWYVVRSLLPEGRTGRVLEWTVTPNATPGWTREPVVQFSQVGYTPGQEKVAIVELDANDAPLATATLHRITADGEHVEAFAGPATEWGAFTRYRYLTFDFSSVTEPGVYAIRYGDQTTTPFVIKPDVYADAWHPTMDVFFPVQMDHMAVNEGYRLWHGVPYLDDALQAPPNIEHFDGYEMGPTTDTEYEALERIPGLDVGGWFDAGDFDIQTERHNEVVRTMTTLWERFEVDRDQTFIDQETRYVDIHRPDGQPDLLQQIEHGTLNLVAQIENIGHPTRGIIVPNLHQYHHLGDASTETDNLPYNPDLAPYETDGVSSGTPDDRWAFTGRSRSREFSTVSALAAAARVLSDFNPDLARRAMASAQKLLDDNAGEAPEADGPARWFGARGELAAALQMYRTTGDEAYAERFEALLWPAMENTPGRWSPIGIALEAVPHLGDDYKARLRPHVEAYREQLAEIADENPYGVPISTGGWAGNSQIVDFAITNFHAHEHYPDLVGREDVLNGLHYVLGRHPYSNVSFVSAVGTVSKEVAYGINRADFGFIAGGVVPGVLMFEPDFFENKEDWPFFWGENEYVLDVSASYVYLVHAANELLAE
ncbi:glycoside hydrolase family 9 protein [Rubrivirga marina]|uniref:glycoside hydrolase family 9 protein n=1 Tax=Rubrivirga marina TaxID=1196024 RepID=UPI000BA9AC1D|nr:glycoside hydrolase family 9 protein [Rubrivirga marina]